MAGKFLARGLNIKGGPEERKALSALAVGARHTGDKKAKSVWSKTLIRNGYEAEFCTINGTKATRWTPKGTDKRVPYGHKSRRYVVFHKAWDDRVIKRFA